ncbi:mast cell protease 1A-like [Erpetoichthys calabaricus]|uniref:trypsin n=1 Tax=Erpetoichthys calabaricus TaxID=27687 RepID=A0A8C4T7P6_ERPCA|nr:mast cell protease 1A-like [Erpetoichthys calabaricus]
MKMGAMKTVYWSTIINICLALSGVSGHRIVAGTVAAPHSRPYMVFLVSYTANGTYMCGGSLIHENVIMTAAHCNGKSITAYVGIHSVSKAEGANLGIHVTKHYPHPDFNDSTLDNDIMLLRLSRRVKLNKTVDLIPYAHSYTNVSVGTACSVAGWGQTTNTSRVSDVLRVVSVKIREIKPLELNARGNNREGACRGDSGGPLVCRIKKVNTAVGVVSWMSPDDCNDQKRLNMYTKVSAYYKWIIATLKEIPQ